MAKAAKGAAKRDKTSGLIYDRDGWKIWHPVPTVWILAVPGVGVVSAMCNTFNQAVQVRVMPIGAAPIEFRGAGVREGITYGIRQTKKLVDIKKVMKILDEAGIRDDMAGVLSVDTHKKLITVINRLMDAAYAGGLEELNQTLTKIASSE